MITASGDGKAFYEAAVKAVLEDRDLQRVCPQEEEICDLLDQTKTRTEYKCWVERLLEGCLEQPSTYLQQEDKRLTVFKMEALREDS